MSFKTTYLNTELAPFYVGGSLATLSADGSILATAVLEDVVITDLSMNETLRKLEGDGELITALQLTPDGKYLAVISQSQQLRIFNLHESKFVKNHKLSSPVFVTSADPTSTLFALGGSDGAVVVFDIENGFVTHSFKGHGSTISALKFHGELNGKNWRLASGDTTGLIKIWDLVKRKAVASLNEHGNAVRGLSFNESYLISGGRDDLLIIWDLKSFKSKKTISAKQQVEACGFISDELVYTAGGDAVLKVWDLQTGKFVTQTNQPIEELLIIGVLPIVDDDKLILILSDQTLFQVDITDIEEGETIEISKKIAGNHGTIADMRYVGPNKNLIALATNSPGLRIIDPISKPLEVEILEGHSDLLNALDSTSDGLWIVTASKDNEARLWKFNEEDETFHTVVVFRGHAGSISSVALPRSNDIGHQPNFLITGSADLTIKKWKIPKLKGDLKLDEPIIVKTSEYTRRAHDKDINAIDISPNDEFFATASYDKTAKVWDLETGETIGVLKGHKRGLWDIKFCKYDKVLVTGSGDKTLKLWSLNDFKCLKTFEGHTNSVQRVEFLNRDKQIISTGADGLIKIWDSSLGECLKTLDMHANRIWAIIVKNNGDEFVSADADGVFQFWVDNTEEVNKETEEALKLKVEQEQSLQNFIHDKNWKNAFLLALKLDHPMRLYNVLKNCIDDNRSSEFIIGEELDAVIKMLTNEQILLLFKRLRNWNVNARFFLVSQKLIKVILKSFEVERLIEIPGLMGFIDSLIPYNERHYSRVDDLIEQSFILDYSIGEMNKVV
jgi:U3 small nucleolar RNA-associated protein 13